MQKFISILSILVILVSCTSGKEMQWRANDDRVIIQLYEPDQLAEEYYAEITNEEGRRFAVNIGLPDEEGKFRIGNNFGKIVRIDITSNLDFE